SLTTAPTAGKARLHAGPLVVASGSVGCSWARLVEGQTIGRRQGLRPAVATRGAADPPLAALPRSRSRCKHATLVSTGPARWRAARAKRRVEREPRQPQGRAPALRRSARGRGNAGANPRWQS